MPMSENGITGDNVAKKKKKMTPAQAAAARRDTTPKRQHTTANIKDNGPVDRGNRMVVGVTIAMVVLIVVLSLVFSVAPQFTNG